MSKIIIPMNYFSLDLNLSLSAENSGYEFRKAFSPDLKEYTIIQKGANANFSFSSINNSFKTGLLFLSDTFYSSTGSNGMTLIKSTLSSFSSYTTLTASNTFGDVTYTGKLTKTLKEYPIETNINNIYFRFSITGSTNVHKFYHICYGMVFDLPDNFRLVDKTYSYKYPLNSIGTNLKGKVYYDGWLNNGLKKEHSLEFEYLNSNEKNILVDVFKYGKGGLPVWFIDDINDSKTWMYAGMKSLNISEPYTEYFKVSMSLKEI